MHSPLSRLRMLHPDDIDETFSQLVRDKLSEEESRLFLTIRPEDHEYLRVFWGILLWVPILLWASVMPSMLFVGVLTAALLFSLASLIVAVMIIVDTESVYLLPEGRHDRVIRYRGSTYRYTAFVETFPNTTLKFFDPIFRKAARKSKKRAKRDQQLNADHTEMLQALHGSASLGSLSLPAPNSNKDS